MRSTRSKALEGNFWGSFCCATIRVGVCLWGETQKSTEKTFCSYKWLFYEERKKKKHQIRNYAHNMIQKRKESASLLKRGHIASNVTIKTYKFPYPTMRLEAIRKITSISCRCYPKSFWVSSFMALRIVSALHVRSVG